MMFYVALEVGSWLRILVEVGWVGERGWLKLGRSNRFMGNSRTKVL